MSPLENLRALEIGAAGLPTYSKDEMAISFADVRSEDDLARQYKKLERTRLATIDYIISSGRPLSEAVDREFSLIIANHVLEHVPDLIGWFDDLTRIATPNALLLLAIPDRRYTFDYLRRETDLIDLVDARARRATRPSDLDCVRNAYYYRPIRAANVWSGQADDIARRRRVTLRHAIEHAVSRTESDADMHCHVFTFDSFTTLWAELEEERLVGWRQLASRGVVEGGNEFVVLLARDPRHYEPDLPALGP